MDPKKIEYLVVDTGAFIKNASIQDVAENVITCQDVVNEVTSQRQIRRMVVLPYDLQVKDVFPENVRFVTEFSKKTGDYPSLSATDIKVIALTYQLEKEKVGSGHLKEVPEAQRTISFQNRPTVEVNDVAGFYVPTSKGKKSVVGDEDSTSDQDISKGDISVSQSATEEDLLSPKFAELHVSKNIQNEGNAPVNHPKSETEGDSCGVVEVGSLDYNVDPASVLVKIQESNTGAGEETASFGSDPEISCGEEEEECESDDDSDGGGWITPRNLSQAKKHMNAKFDEEKSVTVACMTTDFAMQNVLKQIGLNVSSVDGLIIRELRTFILRCYACFKTTSVMTKVFCPHCGHKTLKRVAVSVEPDGSQKIHINLKKAITCRGKKFSLPTFQGGKHANNPIIFADQPVPDQKPSRVARSKTNILDADYIPGFSPFALRDTTSKSAMLGIRGKQEIKHWMQRNPNESRPHLGRKKKK